MGATSVVTVSKSNGMDLADHYTNLSQGYTCSEPVSSLVRGKTGHAYLTGKIVHIAILIKNKTDKNSFKKEYVMKCNIHLTYMYVIT